MFTPSYLRETIRIAKFFMFVIHRILLQRTFFDFGNISLFTLLTVFRICFALGRLSLRSSPFVLPSTSRRLFRLIFAQILVGKQIVDILFFLVSVT